MSLNIWHGVDFSCTRPELAALFRYARAGQGFNKSQFLVDWERQVATCPAGKQSIS
jgi:hypothetical protein